jgi:hypothetical protein
VTGDDEVQGRVVAEIRVGAEGLQLTINHSDPGRAERGLEGEACEADSSEPPIMAAMSVLFTPS